MPKKKQLTEREKGYKKTATCLALLFGLMIFFHFIIISLIYTPYDWVNILIFSLLFIVPAYLSNASMVFTGGGKPIDGGRLFRDGRRVLGDHKTWSGLLKGPLYIGIPISIGIFILFLVLWPIIGPLFELAITYDLYVLYDDISYYQYYFVGGTLPLGFFILIIRIILCAYGAGLGDLVGSFLKRRFNVPSGMPFWVVDQLDFATFSIFLVALPGLFFPSLFWGVDWQIFIFLMILTPAISIIGNNVAYYAGSKDVPW